MTIRMPAQAFELSWTATYGKGPGGKNLPWPSARYRGDDPALTPRPRLTAAPRLVAGERPGPTDRLEAYRYRGSGTLAQTAFGIKPYTGFFGALKLKDEVGVEFEVDLAKAQCAG